MAALAVLSICATAQSTFSRRYDLFGQQLAQISVNIEHRADSGYMVFFVTNYVDTPWLYITTGTLGIDAHGNVVSDTLMLYGMNSIYGGWANSGAQCIDGGYVIGGGTYAPGDIQRAALIRFDANGDSLWLREYGDSSPTWIGRQAKQTPDGGYILAGETRDGADLDGFLIKTDAQGNEEWTQLYGGATQDYLASVDVLPTGGYVAGGFRKIAGTDQMWVIRVTELGAVVWQQVWGSSFDDCNALVTTLQDGSVAVASCWGYANGFTSVRSYLARLDSTNGTVIWNGQYGLITHDAGFLVAKQCNNGTLIAAGINNSLGYYHGTLLCTEGNGDSLWMYYYHYYDSLMNDGRGAFRDVIETENGGFIATGFAHSSFSGNDPPGYTQDVWVVKVDSLGCLEPGCSLVGIHTQITNYLDALRLWPNPVNEVLTISWELPEALRKGNNCRLAVVSASGQLMHTETISLASEQHQLDVRDLSPGLYHLHLVQDGTWVTGGRFVVE